MADGSERQLRTAGSAGLRCYLASGPPGAVWISKGPKGPGQVAPRPSVPIPQVSRSLPGVSSAKGATPGSVTSRWTAQDVTVTRGDQAMFSCIVNFKLPKEEITYSWKFARGGLRTQDLSYFRDVPRAEGYLARIRPAQLTHRGTFSCEIKQDQRPLARLYFFLNVTGPPPRAETELQASFREVLRWAPRDAELIEPWRPSLGELLATPEALTPSNLFLLAALGALASVCATLLVWMFFEWYCSGS
ncbi:sperm acrosome membrane-associated protein 6 isoform X3 [Cebus imitator]|uniref:sperm acrosome membrane-associated protein 6 isoform X3 n=1 Tax=Cebus imitator TaxID=2715852 RepID=UPI001896C39E|nr:sperm acrosome membrane-associated protein 6 isoform X3 [Cebus imitator]XP_037585672.1 sperm acrosome membrane-associated protein 6 isoform X3 [Cebus imitator]